MIVEWSTKTGSSRELLEVRDILLQSSPLLAGVVISILSMGRFPGSPLTSRAPMIVDRCPRRLLHPCGLCATTITVRPARAETSASISMRVVRPVRRASIILKLISRLDDLAVNHLVAPVEPWIWNPVFAWANNEFRRYEVEEHVRQPFAMTAQRSVVPIDHEV